MPFKYENYNEIQKEYSDESIKVADDLKLRFGWRYIYYDALLKIVRKYPDEIIVIPTDIDIMKWLNDDNIPFTMVYPDIHLKQEYERRFIERGNNENFLTVFVDGLEDWVNKFDKIECENRIKLDLPEQYLSHVIKVTEPNDNYIEDKSKYIYDLLETILSNLDAYD